MLLAEQTIIKDVSTATTEKQENKVSLTYLFIAFLKIGSTSWGGFMSLIAVIQKQMGEKDRKIEQDEILHGVSLASVLPGPMAVNVVSFIGYKLRGVKGAFISMAAILLPCFVLMLLLSKLYFTYGDIPAFGKFFAGILPAVGAIIMSVAFTMSKKNIKDVWQLMIALASALLVFFLKSYITTLLIIVASGGIGYLIYFKKQSSKAVAKLQLKRKNLVSYTLTTTLIIFFFWFIKALISTSNNGTLLLSKDLVYTFSGISLTQFGGGYVIIPSMQKIIVDGMHWLSNKEFADAIAMGQVTPGPIFISAAFIGYKLSGIWGALISTISVFLPAGLLMIFCTRFMESIRNSAVVTAVFKGISPAIIGMIFSAAFTILRSSTYPVIPMLCLFITVLFIVIKFKLNPVYVIPLAGIAGLFIF